jgi:hypothetical protein
LESEQITQDDENISVLFPTGRNHGLQAGIDLGPLLSTKTTADLLFDFGRTQVLFSQVIGERHTFHQRKR